MNSPNKRFSYDLATPEDGPALLEILEEHPLPGPVSLLYTRRPDPFASFGMEGREVDIIVCRDRENGRICGMGAMAIRDWHLNGRPEKVGYLFGLRARRDYQGAMGMLQRGYAFYGDLCRERGVDYYLTTILNDNHRARKMLEKRRSFMPNYHYICDYRVYALRSLKETLHPGFTLRPARDEDRRNLLSFYRDNGAGQQFYPVVDEEMFSGTLYPDLNLSDFLILEDDRGALLAAAARWDQQRYKQYVVSRYQGMLKWFAPLSFILPLLRMPPLPRPGSILNFFTLSFVAVRENNAAFLAAFLDLLGPYSRQYPFFLLGLAEPSPLATAARKRPHIAYPSRVYLVDWRKRPAFPDNLDPDYPFYLECGLL